jgi:hypothetical protein
MWLRDDYLELTTTPGMPEAAVLAMATSAVKREVGDAVLVDIHKQGENLYQVILYREQI